MKETELTIIVNVRCASTLIHRCLLDTGQYTLWGESNKLNRECTPLAHHSKWNIKSIIEAWEHEQFSGKVLAKVPSFQYMLDKMLILNPKIIYIKRDIIDKVKSVVSLGWDKKIDKFLTDAGIMYEASKSNTLLGPFDRLDRLCLAFAYAEKISLRTIKHYNDKIILDFDDIIDDFLTTMANLSDFCKLDYFSYFHRWLQLSKQNVSFTKRKGFDKEHFEKPLLFWSKDKEEKLNRIIKGIII